MTIQRFHTNQRMSQAVIHNGTVYLAGQVAQDAPGASVTDQTRNILERIDGLLAEAGSDKNHLLSATLWLNTMDDFAEMNAVWDAWVPEGHAPARAGVESPRLASPKFTVEIGVIAAVK
ncbi:MAG: RidA family protein [Alphaproteobacteria bacterium]|nr:RidA family protein [Alphaproteobacteria bacterium]